MTDRSTVARSSSHLSTARNPDATSVRPRNRRLISTDDTPDEPAAPSTRTSGLLSPVPQAASRSTSPLPFGRSGGASNRRTGDGSLTQFLGDSWNQSWTSIQGLTSSLLGDALPKSPGRSPTRAHSKPRAGRAAGKSAVSWGPEPPSGVPGLSDVAAGSAAERDSALRAARTASLLESHDGVNGGLDITGRHKRRNSDDVAPSHSPQEDYLVYVHRVQPSDTYAGLILRYRCREDAFRKANGLWSRDMIQTRKWLIIPVDSCELRGRPCDPPAWHNSHSVDLLAPTPSAATDSRSGQGGAHGDFFNHPISEEAIGPKPAEEDDKPGVHVRWVQLDSFQQPVEISRVSRQATGFFPPRRRKSIRTVSTFSTPRQSLDLSSTVPGSVEGPGFRRMSSSSNRPPLSSTPVSSRSRVGSEGADGRPAWMRRPGGVGSMGRSVRTPGPGKDYFNTWTAKHIPGLNIEGPSMSVMGSEVANFGFKHGETSDLVESPFEDGRDATSMTRQGNGLDRAAAAVETWLRGALAKRPGTPVIGPRGRQGAGLGADGDGDLIELADTASDDGRGQDANILSSLTLLGSSSRSDGDGFVRGRTMGTAGMKGQKAD